MVDRNMLWRRETSGMAWLLLGHCEVKFKCIQETMGSVGFGVRQTHSSQFPIFQLGDFGKAAQPL